MREKIQDAKRVIRSRKLKKNIQHNGQKKTNNRSNNGPQNVTQKTKEQHEPNLNKSFPEGLAVPVPPVAPVVLLMLKIRWEVILDPVVLESCLDLSLYLLNS
jgi:hypothetical protein